MREELSDISNQLDEVEFKLSRDFINLTTVREEIRLLSKRLFELSKQIKED